MSQQFDEAPPLPRHPTALNVPRAMATSNPEDTVTELPVDAHSLPPPPKFPSLTDVGLPSATAAAASINHPTPRPTSTQVNDDIATSLERDAVVPGTGAKKVIEVGEQMWTLDDQKELELLLSQGKDVYVPPDVTAEDISGRPSSYVLVPDEDGAHGQRSVTDRVKSWNHVLRAEDTDQVEPPAIVVAPVPGTTTNDEHSRMIDEPAHDDPELIRDDPQPVRDDPQPVRDDPQPVRDDPQPVRDDPQPVRDDPQPVRDDPQPIRDDPGTSHDDLETALLPEQANEKEGDTITSRSLGPSEGTTAPPPVDVSKTIFGARFLLVPVTSRRDDAMPTRDLEPHTTEMVETSTDVELRTDSSAHINVTDDYGLKGGHDTGVNDAAFLKDGSLITCGDDGRVCIWDMTERVVDSEFVPYNGEAVTMVYPLPDEEDASAKTIMTLSKSRVVRIWSVDIRQAVLLRSWQIKTSDKALYMTIPHISKEVKARAAAAAAAAAVTTTDAPELPAQNVSYDTVPLESEVPTQTTTSPLPTTPAEATPVVAETPLQDSSPMTAETPTQPISPTSTEGPHQTTIPAEATPSTTAPASAEVPTNIPAQEYPEGEKERKRFSFTKVLSFGRSSGDRKAVPS